jgi:hypothetical protein
MTTINNANKTKLNLRFSFTMRMIYLLHFYRYYSSSITTAVWFQYVLLYSCRWEQSLTRYAIIFDI